MEIQEANLLDKFPPGKQLHREIRSALALKGKTLTGFQRKYPDLVKHPQNIKMATHGIWNGKAGKRVRLKLLEYAGLIDEHRT